MVRIPLPALYHSHHYFADLCVSEKGLAAQLAALLYGLCDHSRQYRHCAVSRSLLRAHGDGGHPHHVPPFRQSGGFHLSSGFRRGEGPLQEPAQGLRCVPGVRPLGADP